MVITLGVGNKRAAYICQIIINYPENQPHHESQSHFASPCASKIFMVAWSWQHHTTHRFVHVFIVAHPIVGVGKIKICVRNKARIDTSLVGVKHKMDGLRRFLPVTGNRNFLLRTNCSFPLGFSKSTTPMKNPKIIKIYLHIICIMFIHCIYIYVLVYSIDGGPKIP